MVSLANLFKKGDKIKRKTPSKNKKSVNKGIVTWDTEECEKEYSCTGLIQINGLLEMADQYTIEKSTLTIEEIIKQTQ